MSDLTTVMGIEESDVSMICTLLCSCLWMCVFLWAR